MTKLPTYAIAVQSGDRAAATFTGIVRAPETAAATSDDAELQALVDRIEEYLLQQIRRLERTIEPTCGVAAQEEAVRELITDHEQERREWESERLKRQARLDDEANLLLDAWGRLEAEHRRLLGLQETLRAASASPPPGSRQNLFNQNSPLTPLEVCQTNNRAGELPGKLPHDQTDLAWLQFQQLKREIQKHARRNP